MKKTLLFLSCLFSTIVLAQSAGFNNTFIVLNVNGTGDLYYDLNGNTSNYDFHNTNIGTFCQGSANGLIFKGGENNVYKCGGCDLTGTRLYYRVYLNGTSGGSFVSNSLNYNSGNNNGCGGADQKWANVSYNVNLLSGLSAGNYTLEVYSDASVTCSGGTIYASNGGGNYKAYFTVNANSAGGTVSGTQSVCSGGTPTGLTLSGHTGNVTKWQRSTSSDFTSGVTDIANTTTTLTGASIGALTSTVYLRAVVTSGVCAPANSSAVTITVVPATVGGTVSGGAVFCDTDNSGTLVLSGHTGSVVKWQSSHVNDFSAGVTDIANTATNLNFSDVSQTTYYRAVVKSGVCGQEYASSAAIIINSNIWTGASQDWNNAVNWSCGVVPTATQHVVIVAATNQPVIDNGMTAYALDLTIGEDASLTIEEGSSIVVTNSINVDEDATVTVRDRANLIQVNDVNNTGNIQVEKLSAPMFRLDYALWSSPVAGETLIGFSPETLPNRFYKYNTANNTYTASGLNNGNVPFTEGVGYLIRMANNHQDYDAATNFIGTPWAGVFTGTPNNGNVTVDASVGFNAVGNPYPSAINIEAFYAANALNLANDAALFFWRKKNGSGYSSYASLTLEGYTANGQVIENANGDDIAYGDASGGLYNDPDNSSEWALGAAQAFIVYSNGNDIVFNNSMRVAGAPTPQFRSAQDTGIPASRLWLNMGNASGEFHQTMLSYSSSGTPGLDYGRDGRALTDGDMSVHTFAGETKLGIQARPLFEASDVVALGYKVTNAGTYTIALDHVTGVFAQGQDIYLRDNVLGLTHDLGQGSYSFTTEGGEIAGRFDIVYAEALGTENIAWDANSIMVYKEGGSITINSGNTIIEGVSVYDMHGRQLYTQSDIDTVRKVIDLLQPQQQMVLVQVKTPKGTVTKKIVH
ncbi:T9SS sorting signal type C domain-containing protein [Flavobacterium sp.]|uniref:T9SS sorting signal type C domain-containing protein n=1 Tax=Flavobacterium sp. TaxID=239 RepID=UPI004033D049